jgi:hypothetical protein
LLRLYKASKMPALKILYAGVIKTKNPKFHLGGDYTHNWDNWLLNIGAIAYQNGDRDLWRLIYEANPDVISLFCHSPVFPIINTF